MSNLIKIAIIGARGYQRSDEDLKLECYEWGKIQKIKNLKDYAGVILNVLEPPPKDTDWLAFSKLLDLGVARDILMHAGAILVLGDPRFEITLWSETRGREIKVPFLYWTGLSFGWDDKPGEVIKLDRSKVRFKQYDGYLRRLDSWDYSLRWVGINEAAMWTIYNKESFRKDGWYFDVDHFQPALTRYGSALASELKIHIRTKARIVEVSGPIVLLPKTSLSTDEAISRVLSDLCGVETEVPEPDWIEGMEAPGRGAIDDEIDRTGTKIRELNENLAGLHEKRSEVRSCLKLLYERGEALEKIVRQICSELGVEVEEPTEPGKEDGWLTFQHGGDVFEGVLEVKSTKSGQFAEDGIRQLLDWISRGMRLRKKKYKGIFIGTNAVEKRLEDRPYAFSESWRASAELAEICALKTEDLYRAYILHSEDKLDTDALWSKVFSTNGIFDSEFLGNL
jgi:hypothetical protein